MSSTRVDSGMVSVGLCVAWGEGGRTDRRRDADPLHLRSGVEAGMVVPDAVDTDDTSVRVLRDE